MFFISHFAVTSNPITWRVVGHIHDFLIGASYHVWVYQVNCIARDRRTKLSGLLAERVALHNTKTRTKHIYHQPPRLHHITHAPT